jgi:hypothetical protein
MVSPSANAGLVRVSGPDSAPAGRLAGSGVGGAVGVLDRASAAVAAVVGAAVGTAVAVGPGDGVLQAAARAAVAKIKNVFRICFIAVPPEG